MADINEGGSRSGAHVSINMVGVYFYKNPTDLTQTTGFAGMDGTAVALQCDANGNLRTTPSARNPIDGFDDHRQVGDRLGLWTNDNLLRSEVQELLHEAKLTRLAICQGLNVDYAQPIGNLNV